MNSNQWYSRDKNKKVNDNPLKYVSELCDVCGKDIPIREVQRIVWLSPTGIRFVIRKHPSCDLTQLTQYLS